MNNQNVGGNNYPYGYASSDQLPPRQPAQPVQQPVSPRQPIRQSARSQQPVRPVYQQPIVPQPVKRPEPEHTLLTRETISSMSKALFVILSAVFGWICSRTLFSFEYGIGMTVMGLSFYLIYIPFILFKQNKQFSLFGWLLFIPQAVILVSFAFFSDTVGIIVGLISSLLIAAVQTTLLSNCTTGKPFTFDLICDTCINYLALPFMNLVPTVIGFFSGKDKGDKKGKNTLKIAIGAAISVPVVFILIMIFAYSDKMFARWVSNILTVLNLNPVRITADILLTMVVMLYVMPLVVTLRSGYNKKYNHKNSRRLLDPVIIATVLYAASVVYLMFVAVQFTYLFAGIGSLPDGITLSEYSRRGFFELVIVIVITTVVIAAVCMLTKTGSEDRLPVYVKIALLIITASNTVIIISAARRLLIYIDAYSLTVSRFSAAVLIALMAALTLTVALRIIFDTLRISVVVGIMLTMAAAVYCIINVDGFVAKYNVNKYLEDPVKYRIDIEYMAEHLSSSAIPQLERVMDNASDDVTKDHAKLAIANIAYRCNLFEGDRTHIARWTVDRQIAVNIIDKYDITEEMADEYFDKYISTYSSYRYL